MNKNKILFFNVGNRDIKIEGNELKKDEIRSKSKEIFNNFERYKKNISAEIITPFLNQFKDTIKKIYLFVTNQEDSRYNNQDTLYFGRIIQKIIEEDYKIGCEVKEYIHNPTDYEVVFDFFMNFFKNFDDSELKIISNSGGVPSMKFSVLIIASSLFNNLEVYSVDEKSNEIKKVEYKNTIKKEFIKRSALEFLDRYNYSAIISLVDENRIENKKLMLLLEYCKYRLSFDFETANNKLSEFLTYLDSVQRKEFERYLLQFDKDQKKLISELWLSMHIKLTNEEYADFISRLFRFSEAVVQYLFSLYSKIEIDWSKKEEVFEKVNNFISNYEGLPNFLSHDKKLEEIGEKYIPNKHVLTMCLRYFLNKDIKIGKELMNKIGKINSLIDKLRHISIVAHGFEGVTRDKIIKEYKGAKEHGEDIIEGIGYICNECGINKEEGLNDILTINSHIKNLIFGL